MGHSTTKWTKNTNLNIVYLIKCNFFSYTQYAKVHGSENQIAIEVIKKNIACTVETYYFVK